MAGRIQPVGTRDDAAVVCGIGYWLPPTAVTNAELCTRLDTSEEWIRSRTGISTRRVASAGVKTSDLAVEAGARALQSAGGGGVQALVLATTTPDRPCPATAPAVASRLGLTGIAAFDVSAVCTGFLYGLATATGLIATGVADRTLLIAAETFTTLLDPQDRTTVPIFGDGAGALVLRRGLADEAGAIGPVLLGSDGDRSDAITVEAGGTPAAGGGPADGHRPGFFQMRGREVFRLAVDRMASTAAAAAEAAGWPLAEVDRLVAHQANSRIIAAVATALGIPEHRRAQNIREVGNTAAASIPVLLAQAGADGLLKPDDRVLLTAFGGGLTWGAATMVWPDLDYVP